MTSSERPAPAPLAKSVSSQPQLSAHDHLVRDELRPLQLAELEVLDHFIKLTAQHQLRYFATGGTLLGAVRHKGFIPWDDDVDVVMPRPDFERLSAVMRNEPGINHTWSDFHTSSDYPFVYAKLGMLGTQFYEYRTEHLSMPHSVAIDIFPLDGVPDNRLRRLLHRVALRLLQLRISASSRRPWRRAILARLLCIVPRSSSVRAYELLSSWAPYESSRFIGNLAGHSGYVRNIVPKSWYFAIEQLPFETLTVAAPSMWDAYLRHIYGDYMSFPPDWKRRGRHKAKWALGSPRSADVG